MTGGVTEEPKMKGPCCQVSVKGGEVTPDEPTHRTEAVLYDLALVYLLTSSTSPQHMV